jgi:hypothetical protein
MNEEEEESRCWWKDTRLLLNLTTSFTVYFGVLKIMFFEGLI